MNPIDELAALLPPGPADRELPLRELRKAELLAVMTAGPDAARRPGRGWRKPAAARWLMPSLAATAVVIVALLALAVPQLVGGSGPGPAQPGAGAGGKPAGPPAGSQLTVTRNWSVPAGDFSSVAVSTNSGQITVTGGSRTSAAITATPSYRGSAPVITSQIAGGTLAVTAHCPTEPNCEVRLTLKMPAGVPVRATSDQGDLRLTGLTGGAVATTAQGNISLRDLAGRVTADTQQGDIDLTAITGSIAASTSQGTISAVGLAAPRVTLSTEQGDVSAAFRVAPELVTATTQEGSVTITLPAAVIYDVVAQTEQGSTSVTVPRSISSPHVIRATSQQGSVTVAAG